MTGSWPGNIGANPFPHTVIIYLILLLKYNLVII